MINGFLNARIMILGFNFQFRTLQLFLVSSVYFRGGNFRSTVVSDAFLSNSFQKFFAELAVPESLRDEETVDSDALESFRGCTIGRGGGLLSLRTEGVS